MSTYNQIKKGIPSTINIPNELEVLCNWLNENGYPISGYFQLTADDGNTMKHWLGFDDLSDRFGLFVSFAASNSEPITCVSVRTIESTKF